MKHLLILAAVVLSAALPCAAQPPEQPAEPAAVSRVKGVVIKVEQAVARGAKTAASGIERGAQAAVRGVKIGVHAAAEGIEKGAKATARAAETVASKVRPTGQ